MISRQADWHSAVWFIHELHCFLLFITSVLNRIIIIIASFRSPYFVNRELKQRRFWATHVTGSEAFSLSIYLGANKFVLLSFFSLIKTIYQRVSTKPLPNDAKSPLPVDVRRSKTPLLKLPNISVTKHGPHNWLLLIRMRVNMASCQQNPISNQTKTCYANKKTWEVVSWIFHSLTSIRRTLLRYCQVAAWWRFALK